MSAAECTCSIYEPHAPWCAAAGVAARVERALDLHREHLTATPSRQDGTPYRGECVGCHMARVLLGQD